MAVLNARLHRFRYRLGRARTIKPQEWLVLGQAWLGLLVVDLLLKRKGYPWVQARMRALRPASRPSRLEISRGEIERCHELVAMAAGNHVRPMLCLRRALTLQWLLLRRGERCDVRLGVARGQEGLDAHAWVEWNDRVIGDSPDVRSRYQPLPPGESPP